MNNRIYKIFRIALLKLLLIFTLIINIACRKDFSPSWDTDMLIPLANTELGINNIIHDSLLGVNPDNSLSLVFRNNIYNFIPDSIFPYPDTITKKEYSLPISVTIDPGQVLFNFTEVNKLNFAPAEIFFGEIKSGVISLVVINKLNEEIICNYKINSATKNGNVLELQEKVPKYSEGGNLFIKEFDVSAYKIDFRGPNYNKSNRLTTSFSVTLSPNANSTLINPQDSLIIFVTFKNLQLEYAKGYFGQTQHFLGPDTTKFNLFNKITGGSISLDYVKANLYVENSFGIDASVLFNNITAINSRNNQSVSLISPLIGKPLNITRASETNNIAAPCQPSIYNYDLSASNILDLIECLPNCISYSAKIDINPLGNISSGNDFVYYANGLRSYLDFELALSLIAQNLCLSDTIALNINNNFDNISEGNLIINADNGFPFNAKLQFYLLDENNFICDSLVNNGIIESAIIDNNNIVTKTKKSFIDIELNKQKINKLKDAKRMIIKVIFNTANNSQKVKIFDNYKISITISGDFKYLINTKEF